MTGITEGLRKIDQVAGERRLAVLKDYAISTRGGKSYRIQEIDPLVINILPSARQETLAKGGIMIVDYRGWISYQEG